MRVSSLGEFGLIAHLDARLQRHPGLPRPSDLVGIGDDAAIWRPSPLAASVITTDALVAGVHFDLATTSWYDLGWKALAANVSDIAAMGAHPRLALVTLALAGDPPVAEVEALYDGMADLAAEYGVALAGGDTVRSPHLFLNLTVVGESEPIGEDGEWPLLQRARARPGDLVAVTGHLGASGGGLRWLSGDRPAGAAESAAAPLVDAHLRPRPRVAEGLACVAAGLRCGMDLSDGLLGDLTRIAEAADVGAVIQAAAVPIHPALHALYPDDALTLALTGGEDYELCVCGPPPLLATAAALLEHRRLQPLTVVGHVVEAPASGPRVRVVDEQGQPIALGRGAWDHFRSPSAAGPPAESGGRVRG